MNDFESKRCERPTRSEPDEAEGTEQSAPAHLFAYADESANAAETPQTSKQVDGSEDAALSGQNDQEESEKEGKSSIAEAVRTASEASGLMNKGVEGIPTTSAIALGLAAIALLAVAFKLKA